MATLVRRPEIMKRSVAILGSTPQFVRWAIRHSCPLRQFTGNLADNSFRQLRGLRALSVGNVENRVVDGVCIHPDADPDAVEKVRGFVAAEVLDAFGGEADVAAQCYSCPANAVDDSAPGIWTGCYGLLPGDASFEFDLIREANQPKPIQFTEPEVDLSVLIDQAVEKLDLQKESEALFPKTSPRWYGIWQSAILAGPKLDALIKIFDEVESLLKTSSRDVTQFCDALKRCKKFGLELHVELVPPGHSDGQTWTISNSCPACKAAMTSGERQCLCCKRKGNPHEVVRNKVVGLRPYVFLSRVLGIRKTEELVRRWKEASLS